MCLLEERRTNPAFSKPLLCLSDTCHFRSFCRFRGSEQRNPYFQWVEGEFVIFAVFVNAAPFWQWAKTRLPKRPSHTEIAAIFAICDCDAHRGPQKSQRFPRREKAMLHCDLRVRWKVASDLRFRAAISEPKTHSFCGISGDLAPSTRKSLAIAIVRFWCAKEKTVCATPICSLFTLEYLKA